MRLKQNATALICILFIAVITTITASDAKAVAQEAKNFHITQPVYEYKTENQIDQEIMMLSSDYTPTDTVSSATGVNATVTDNSVTTRQYKTYNGISEGDVMLGNLSFYCICQQCCGSTKGVTASGVVIQNGMDNPYIVACNWLPLGSVVKVQGNEYRVMDRGGDSLARKGRLDVFEPRGHKQALINGRQDVTIEIVRIGE